MSAPVMLMVRFGASRHIRLSDTASERDKWWLVEAENVDAARKVIEHFKRDPDATCVHGRVLASGGKK